MFFIKSNKLCSKSDGGELLALERFWVLFHCGLVPIFCCVAYLFLAQLVTQLVLDYIIRDIIPALSYSSSS